MTFENLPLLSWWDYDLERSVKKGICITPLAFRLFPYSWSILQKIRMPSLSSYEAWVFCICEIIQRRQQHMWTTAITYFPSVFFSLEMQYRQDCWNFFEEGTWMNRMSKYCLSWVSLSSVKERLTLMKWNDKKTWINWTESCIFFFVFFPCLEYGIEFCDSSRRWGTDYSCTLTKTRMRNLLINNTWRLYPSQDKM